MIALALALFAAASLLLLHAQTRLQQRPPRNTLLRYWSEHFALPLGRALCLMVFIAGAYPALFGARQHAPPLQALLAEGRLGHWVNALFLSGLLLPMLPFVRWLPAMALPLQGGIGVAMLATWYAAATDTTAILMPPWSVVITLLLFAIAAPLIAHALASRISRRTAGESSTADLLLLWLQLPILLAYGATVGRSL